MQMRASQVIKRALGGGAQKKREGVGGVKGNHIQHLTS